MTIEYRPDMIIRKSGDWLECEALQRRVHVIHVAHGQWEIVAYDFACITRQGIVTFKADMVAYAKNRLEAWDKAQNMIRGYQPTRSGIQMRLF